MNRNNNKILHVALLGLMSLYISYTYAQGVTQPEKSHILSTDSLKILGRVKSSVVYRLGDLDTFTQISAKDQFIYNHNGSLKQRISGIKGIPIKRLLADVEFDYKTEMPKSLNEFYFVCVASDGYKVVFSWNEIYNTEIGNGVLLITEMDGKKLVDINQRLLLISTSDLKLGRRYVKGLSRIEVCRIE